MTARGTPVNPDLAIILERLRSTVANPGLDWAKPPVPLLGGFWAEMWVGDLVGAPPGWPTRVVVRLSPQAGTAAREVAVQRAVAAQGFATPAIRAFGSAEKGGIGRAWSVMDFVQGRSMLDGLDGFAALRHLPTVARDLPDKLAACMVALHALDVEPVRAALTAAGDGSVGLDGLIAHLTTEADRLGHAELRRVLAALAGARPLEGPAVVCHGDLHPFNMLATEAGPVLLDWTAAQVADPAYDLAFTSLLLGIPPLVAPAPLDRVIGGLGRLVARRFRKRYVAHGGAAFPAETLRWHLDLCAVRSLTEAESWVAAGTLDEHRGHPWLAMAPALWKQLQSRR